MILKLKWIALALCAAFLVSSSIDTADARPRSSFRSSRSSRSITRSRPKYNSSRPRTGNKSKYSSSGRATRSNKPKYGSGTKRSGNSLSRKPTGSTSNKSRSRNRAYSQRKYVATKKATAPPKSKYTASNGKTVKVRTNSSTVKSIRSKPSTYYTPAKRQERYTTVINNYNYSHPYSWYGNQPYYYVGGGYSSAFWWMMMTEWSAERRARWLYHNQNTIERVAYEKGMQDAAVAAEIARLKTQNAQVNPDYVDSDFKDNPDLMYSQEYVEAAYNPTIVPQPSGIEVVLLWVKNVLLWTFVLAVVGTVVWLVVFRIKVTS